LLYVSGHDHPDVEGMFDFIIPQVTFVMQNALAAQTAFYA
jgi:hypothetical protein